MKLNHVNKPSAAPLINRPGRVEYRPSRWPLTEPIAIITITILLSANNPIEAINPVLDLNETFPYLINRTSGQAIEPRDYMDFENIYVPNATYKSAQAAQSRNYHLIKAFDFANYFQSDYWHYSSDHDLRLSAYPVANESRCGHQLDWLERQLNASSGAALWAPGEQHVNLMTLVDSFGKPESSTYLGHGYWLGSYYECLRNSIDMEQFEREECGGGGGGQASCGPATGANNSQPARDRILKSRYCIGKVRESDWPTSQQDNYTPGISYKVGLCLPESCETLSFRKHRHQLERLMQFNLPEYMKSRMQLADLYCLPDSRSPLRELPFSSRIYLAVCAAWLVALVGASSIYSCYRRHQRDIRSIMRAEQLERDLELDQCQQEQDLLRATAMDHCGDLAAKSAIVYEAEAEHVNLDSKLHHSSPQINYTLCAADHDQRRQVAHLAKSGPDVLVVPAAAVAAASRQESQSRPAGEKQAPPQQFRRLLTTSAQLLVIRTQASLGALAGGQRVRARQSYGPATKQEQFLVAEESKSTASSQRTSASSLASWLSESPLTIQVLKALSISENLADFQQPPAMLRAPQASRRLRVNLNALDSIKCLCCVLVIFGHIVFIHMQHLSNILHTIELSHELAPRILIAFFNFVDTFFIISGMLTSYFVFKRFNKRSFSNPLVWIHISFLRLLRLSPVYILVFWFSKTISVYLSEGPIWDYGTDAKSNKGLCINDHWWKSILYFGNLGTMQPLCILPAWSIIVDSQYSLLVPPILFILFKHKRLGYLTLLVAVVISTANMSWMLATQTAVKTSDMAKIRLHVYPLISRFAAEFYNTAWNRVGPVAIGIVGGHLLYLYDVGTIRRWPWFMRDAVFKMVLLLHLTIFVLPALGRFTDDPQVTSDSDMTIFVLSNATIKPIWSLINTIFLLRLVTDLRHHSVIARLMSHNLWHYLGKLCFASYLIHYEIILILLKSRQEGLVDPTWLNALREFSAAFLISTVISYFIYILFESPINKLITLFLMSPNHRQNIDDVDHKNANSRDEANQCEEPDASLNEKMEPAAGDFKVEIAMRPKGAAAAEEAECHCVRGAAAAYGHVRGAGRLDNGGLQIMCCPKGRHLGA